MTVSEWLLEFLRNCEEFPNYLLYNSLGEESNSIAIVENIGQTQITRFVDGSHTASNPFMLLMRTNQAEADEIVIQNVFSKVVSWIARQPLGAIDDNTSIIEIEPTTNLIPIERDEQGGIIYQAIFNVKYFKGVENKWL